MNNNAYLPYYEGASRGPAMADPNAAAEPFRSLEGTGRVLAQIGDDLNKYGRLREAEAALDRKTQEKANAAYIQMAENTYRENWLAKSAEYSGRRDPVNWRGDAEKWSFNCIDKLMADAPEELRDGLKIKLEGMGQDSLIRVRTMAAHKSQQMEHDAFNAGLDLDVKTGDLDSAVARINGNKALSPQEKQEYLLRADRAVSENWWRSLNVSDPVTAKQFFDDPETVLKFPPEVLAQMKRENIASLRELHDQTREGYIQRAWDGYPLTLSDLEEDVKAGKLPASDAFYYSADILRREEEAEKGAAMVDENDPSDYNSVEGALCGYDPAFDEGGRQYSAILNRVNCSRLTDGTKKNFIEDLNNIRTGKPVAAMSGMYAQAVEAVDKMFDYGLFIRWKDPSGKVDEGKFIKAEEIKRKVRDGMLKFMNRNPDVSLEEVLECGRKIGTGMAEIKSAYGKVFVPEPTIFSDLSGGRLGGSSAEQVLDGLDRLKEGWDDPAADGLETFFRKQAILSKSLSELFSKANEYFPAETMDDVSHARLAARAAWYNRGLSDVKNGDPRIETDVKGGKEGRGRSTKSSNLTLDPEFK